MLPIRHPARRCGVLLRLVGDRRPGGEATDRDRGRCSSAGAGDLHWSLTLAASRSSYTPVAALKPGAQRRVQHLSATTRAQART